VIEVASIILEELDLPDLVVGLPIPHQVAGEHAREVDLPFADLDPAAASHAHGTVSRLGLKRLVKKRESGLVGH
jgi:hypothetical protein